ncbi:MAG: hypothetical protein IPF47_06515 [Gemmatimonadetes bacterium]|nr:hypothetical protein [Gemmatimonadota bacterium]
MGIYASVASARVSLTRVQEILDTPVEVSDPVAPTAMPTCRGAVALRDVAYTFDRGAVLEA